MLHVLKTEVFIRGGGGGKEREGEGGKGTRPPLSGFSGSAPGKDSYHWETIVTDND